MDTLRENYEWIHIPENLPKENLVMVIAKTTAKTIHPLDPKYPVRIFKPNELLEAARSLAKRPVGLNHGNLIELSEEDQLLTGSKYAFTVDANYNFKEQTVESLLFLPRIYVQLVREKKIEEVSVEYSWRDENRTQEGVEFIGLVFDRVDLLYGVYAGDKYTETRAVEGKRGLMEAEFTAVGSSPTPTVQGASEPLKVDKANADMSNTKTVAPMIPDSFKFECSECHTKYEMKYDGTKKEWGAGCVKDKEKLSESVPANNTTPTQSTVIIPPKEDPNVKRILELEEAVTRLQNKVKEIDTDKDKIIKDSKKEAKRELIEKIEKVLPEQHIISRMNMRNQSDFNRIRKILYEES